MSAPATRTTLGRFELAEQLGSGAAGSVFAAVDPTLDRRVAIKLLHEGGDTVAEQRLLREARSLARLAHPNVVTVYEAGIDAGRVYLVMELVVGRTARAWLEVAARSAHEIIAVYRQAGNGLSAAHAAGLVHRDVKPENILVGEDGRVRVTDFGLVAPFDGDNTNGDDEPDISDDQLGRMTIRALTRTGILLGTPAYMSPEAHRRMTLDAPSDQFALCVSLWEALAGARPFAGGTYRELVRAVTTGAITGGDRIAPSVRAVLARGLATDPAGRWPSISALFAALDDALTSSAPTPPDTSNTVPAPSNTPAPSRYRWLGAAIAGGAVLAGGSIAVERLRGSSDVSRGASAPVRVEGTRGCPSQPVFADNTTLVFDDVDESGVGIYRMTLGGTPSPLVTGPHSEWRTSNGRRPGEVTISISEANNSRPHYLDVRTGAVTPNDIGPTNTFAATRDALYYLRTDGTEIRRLRERRDEAFVVMPDSRQPYTLAASSDGTRLLSITIGGRRQPAACVVDIREPSNTRCDEEPALLSARGALGPDESVYLPTAHGIVRRDSRGSRRVVEGVAAWSGLDVSPDGRTLAYSDCVWTTRVRPIGDGPPIAEGMISDIAAGADDQLVFVRERAGGRVIVLRRQTVERELTTASLGWVSQPALSPDGNRVAFKLAGAAPGIYVIGTAPTPLIRVSNDANDGHPTWTADGRVAFTRFTNDSPSVVIVDAAARGAPTLAIENRVTMDRVATTGELILLSPELRTISLWDPSTGRETVVEAATALNDHLVYFSSATPDGAWLLVQQGVWGEVLWRVPIGARDGRVAERIHTLPRGNSADRAVALSDGTIYVSDSEWSGHLWHVALP